MTRSTLSAALLLAACATPQGLRDNAPAFSVSSSRPAAEVLGCIGEAWSRYPATSVNTVPGSGRTSIILNGANGSEVLVDVGNDGNVTAYVRGTLLGGNGRRPIEAARQCAG